MIPSVLVSQIRRGIEEYLLTTFPVTNPFSQGALEDLLDREDGIFRGPYISLKRPFLGGDSGKTFFPGVLPETFQPFKHQQLAWERLQATRSTIVATGTGSGKTECFLYPILDHCLKHRSEKGIKDMKAGTVQRTIQDDTLPTGPCQKTITYTAPFDRCHREADYRTAWKAFSERTGSLGND